jgi:carbon-monoxide dehydrogenase medium subunit
MKPAAFEYHRAHDVEEAVSLLWRLGDGAKLLAGGQSLVPMMNFRLARPTALVDISRLCQLSYLQRSGGTLAIGALTPHQALEAPGIEGYGVLAKAARWVGHWPIRTRGTIGGSLAHADPAAEWCALALLLEAEIVACGPAGERRIPAASFFHGFLTTALEFEEMITEVRFPKPVPHAALTEFSQRQGDFAVVLAAARLDLDGETCRAATIVLGGVDSVPRRVPGAEAVLAGAPATGESFSESAEVAASEIEPPSDIHGSAWYRRRLARTLVARALQEAAGGG